MPPTLNPIGNVTVIQGTTSVSIGINGISSGSPTQKQLLRVTATSSEPGIVPTPMVSYVSPRTNGVLTLRPKPVVGAAVVTVTVNNGGKSNNIIQQSFTVTVVSNQPPTLAPIADMTVAKNAPAQSITLTGITAGSPYQTHSLSVTVLSSNPRLIPAPSIKYSSPQNTAQLTFRPLPNETGTSTITVTVNNGGLNNNVIHQLFVVTVTVPSTNDVVAMGAESNTKAALTAVGLARGHFSFNVTGASGSNYVVEATSDLVHWTPIQTNTAPFTFQENAATTPGQRFYRVSLH